MQRFEIRGEIWYGAATPPIDWWPGWTSIERFHRELDKLWDWGVEAPPELDTSLAQQVAKQMGWEGDGGWKCAPLPTDDGYCKLMYAVKQSNNGTTFIVSPLNLPWL